jgi:membrane-associated phospholipid phosphatase
LLKLTDRNLLWIWLPLVISIILLSVIHFIGCNSILFLAINSLYRLTGNNIWANLTILGDGLIATIILILLIRRRPDIVWIALIAYIVSTICLRLGKWWLDVPRPPAVLTPEAFNLIGPCYKYNSFPSGHATTIFALAGVLTIVLKDYRLKLGILLSALIISISRIVLGIHWPLDILCGMIIGWISSLIGLAVINYLRWHIGEIKQRAIGVILLSASIFSLTFYKTGYNQALWMHRIISLACVLIGGYELLQLNLPYINHIRNFIRIRVPDSQSD